MNAKRLTAAMLSAGLILAAAATGAASADRIRLVNVHGYSVIDNQHLVLNGSARRHYLVTLRNRCNAIRWGHQLATSFPSTVTLHEPIVEYVYAQDSHYRCYIDTIEEVDSVDAARELVSSRADAEESDTAVESR